MDSLNQVKTYCFDLIWLRIIFDTDVTNFDFMISYSLFLVVFKYPLKFFESLFYFISKKFWMFDIPLSKSFCAFV